MPHQQCAWPGPGEVRSNMSSDWQRSHVGSLSVLGVCWPVRPLPRLDSLSARPWPAAQQASSRSCMTACPVAAGQGVRVAWQACVSARAPPNSSQARGRCPASASPAVYAVPVGFKLAIQKAMMLTCPSLQNYASCSASSTPMRRCPHHLSMQRTAALSWPAHLKASRSCGRCWCGHTLGLQYAGN